MLRKLNFLAARLHETDRIRYSEEVLSQPAAGVRAP